MPTRWQTPYSLMPRPFWRIRNEELGIGQVWLDKIRNEELGIKVNENENENEKG